MTTSVDRDYYILLGGAEHYNFFVNNKRFRGNHWFWTVTRGAQVGEKAFIYLTAPLSRIVGQVEIIAAPFYNVDMFKGKKTKNRWMAEVGNVIYFPQRRELTMSGLRELFPDWNWLFYPRGNTKIPAQFVRPLLELTSAAAAA